MEVVRYRAQSREVGAIREPGGMMEGRSDRLRADLGAHAHVLEPGAPLSLCASPDGGSLRPTGERQDSPALTGLFLQSR